MANITEEMCRKAIEIWKKENPDKDYSEITFDTKVIIDGKEIRLGNKITAIRNIYKMMQEGKKSSKGKDLTEEQVSYWSSLGLLYPKFNITEEEYRKAVEVWKKQNPNKDYSEITKSTVVIVDGIEIPIGKKIIRNRAIYTAMLEGKKSGTSKELTDEQILYWGSLGLLQKSERASCQITEEEYRKAVEVWKKENPDKDYSEITFDTKVIIDGKEIRLGNKITAIRNIYKRMQEGKKSSKGKYLTDEQIAYWSSLGLIHPKFNITEEEYRKAVEVWKKQNPNKDYFEITKSTVVIVDEKEIPIGRKIIAVRSAYKTMQEGKKQKATKDLTEDDILFWKSLGLLEKSIKAYERITEEEYREATEVWKKENPNKDYSEIRVDTNIELNGKRIPLGNRISRMRQIYKAMQEGKKSSSGSLTDEQILYWRTLGVLEPKIKRNNTSISKQSTLEKYTEIFNGDKEKAERVVKCLTDLKERRKAKKKEDYDIENILKEFDVDIETLEKYLNRIRSKESTKSDKPLEYQGLTLREFCIKNGYNYDVVYRAVKLHDFCKNDTLEQLINRSLTTYQKNGQKEPSTWVYEKYGTLVKHILLYLRLDASKILNDMSNYTISLEEAIRHNVFLRTKKTKEQDYLEEVYNYLIEEVDSSKTEEEIIQDIVLKYQELARVYRFTKEEHEVVINSFERYIKTIKEYQKADVGLETNQTRKIEKIKNYGLEPEDIEESFFIPLEFDNKVLLGRKSELYLRRQLLRQYIIDWDFYTEEEKEVIKMNNRFTEEEIKIIESTRKYINEVIEKTR